LRHAIRISFKMIFSSYQFISTPSGQRFKFAAQPPLAKTSHWEEARYRPRWFFVSRQDAQNILEGTPEIVRPAIHCIMFPSSFVLTRRSAPLAERPLGILVNIRLTVPLERDFGGAFAPMATMIMEVGEEEFHGLTVVERAQSTLQNRLSEASFTWAASHQRHFEKAATGFLATVWAYSFLRRIGLRP